MSAEPIGRPIVLIIEDVAGTREVIEMSLRSLGADFHSARDGLEGLQQAVTVSPDLIILDLALPTMKGDEVLRHLRRDPRTEHIPVLVVTAHGQSELARMVLDLGADGFMEKPFLPAELLATSARLLDLPLDGPQRTRSSTRPAPGD